MISCRAKNVLWRKKKFTVYAICIARADGNNSETDLSYYITRLAQRRSQPLVLYILCTCTKCIKTPLSLRTFGPKWQGVQKMQTMNNHSLTFTFSIVNIFVDFSSDILQSSIYLLLVFKEERSEDLLVDNTCTVVWDGPHAPQQEQTLKYSCYTLTTFRERKSVPLLKTDSGIIS